MITNISSKHLAEDCFDLTACFFITEGRLRLACAIYIGSFRCNLTIDVINSGGSIIMAISGKRNIAMEN